MRDEKERRRKTEALMKMRERMKDALPAAVVLISPDRDSARFV